MDNPLFVGVLNSSGQRFNERGSLLGRLWRLPQPIAQAGTGDKFQCQEQTTFMLPHLNDLHDVGMVQARGRVGLAPKSLATMRIEQVDAWNQLDRDASAFSLIDRFINNPHAAPAHLANNAILAQAN